MSVLKIKDEKGNIIEIPALKGDNYILTDDDKQEIADIITVDMEIALDSIIAIQNLLIGGEGV